MTNSRPAKPSGGSSGGRADELERKIFHGCIGFITSGLYLCGVKPHHIGPALLVAFVLMTILEIARFKSANLNRKFVSAVGTLMRPRERACQETNGTLWYLLGLAIVFYTCPNDIVLIATLTLSWADLAANIVGKAIGNRWYSPKLVGSKSLAGSTAAAIVGVLVTYYTYNCLLKPFPRLRAGCKHAYDWERSPLPMWKLSACVGLIAAVAELFPIINDNLSIPVVTGFAVQAAISVFERLS